MDSLSSAIGGVASNVERGLITQTTVSVAAWPRLLALLAAWTLTVLCSAPLGIVFGESGAYLAAAISCAIGIVIAFFFVVRPLLPNAGLRPLVLMLSIYTMKVIYAYLYHARIIEPGGGLILQPNFYTAEGWSQWDAIWRVSTYWHTHGFTLVDFANMGLSKTPLGYTLLSLPYLFLPAYHEILFVWQSFFPVITACAVLLLARIEDFDSRICCLAFYLALLSPFAWNPVWIARDLQGQMLAALAFCTMLLSRRHPVALVASSLASAWLLKVTLRVEYAILIACMALFFLWQQRSPWRWVLSAIAAVALLIAFPQLGVAIVQTTGNIFTGRTGYQNLPALSLSVAGLAATVYRLALGFFTPTLYGLLRFSLVTVAQQAEVILGLALFALCVYGIVKGRLWHEGRLATVVYGLMFVVSGTIGYAVHPEYVQVGMVFLLPFALQQAHNGFSRWLGVAFLVWGELNILWILVFH